MALSPAGKGGAAETTPMKTPVDNGPINSLENRVARAEMHRENAASSLPASAIRKLESKRGARR